MLPSSKMKNEPTTPSRGTEPVREAAPPVALRSKTRAVLEKAFYWKPPVGDWKPLKTSRNSTLRIACIAENRVAQGLEFEGELLLLTPGNWRQVLQHGKPDLLLVESVLLSCTGHWHMGQIAASPEHGQLVEIVRMARELSIPSVFWMTKGHEYHEHYRDYARHFDLVACADPAEIGRLAAEGVRAVSLPPCVQPALYNPFRRFGEDQDLGLDILFDGWADIDRLGEQLDVLHALKPLGLCIVESRYEMFRNRLNILPEYHGHILGCLRDADRRIALKHAKAYATSAASLSTATTQQWMSLEAAASRVPVVHLGWLDKDDPRRDFAVECGSATDFVVEFIRYGEDDLYRERMAHLAWRAVNTKHTFAHRLQAICRHLGLRHDWKEYPKASLITPSYRKDMLARCLQTYEQIQYPNKELVLVFNGGELPTPADLGLAEPRADVTIAHVPGELFAGATLNMGHLHASGAYCFRIDDDDFYAPNYILDMVLFARSIDADLFGKPAAPYKFEGEDAVYVKQESRTPVVVTLEQLQGGEVWLGGNSIAATSAFFHRHAYSSDSFGAADTDLVLNLPPGSPVVIAILDWFNMAAERRQDLSSHTWKNSAEKLKRNRRQLANLDELYV